MEPWMEERLTRLRELMAAELLDGVAQEVSGMHPADLAHLADRLDEEEKIHLFRALEPTFAAEVVVELSDHSREEVLEGLSTRRLSAIVDDMPSDEATDIIADLPADQAREVLARIDLEDSDEVKRLLQYAEDTAGGLMQLELVAVRSNQTVAQTIEAIRKKSHEVGEIHYVYVVDADNRLMGYVPLTQLVLSEPQLPVRNLLMPCSLVVEAHEDQEEVAHKFRRYDVVSAPVVDEEGRLLGRITIDDVMEVMEEEAREDILRMAGASAEEFLFHGGGIFKTSRLRLPWLLTNMAGGLVTGWLLWLFKVNLSDALVLLAFIPVIMAMAGNVGVQSSTIIVRGFAVGQVTFGNLTRVLFKELRVALVMGVVCGLLVGGAAHLWHGRGALGLVVGLAMACSIGTASLMGTLAPAMFKKLNVDPAISSGPVVTTFNDMLGILIYFLIASAFYEMLVA
jgi:magnesium transporter